MLVEKAAKVEGKAPRLRATPLGHIAARHLLAPSTLLLFKRAVEAQPLTFFDLLFVACSSPDCEPVLPVNFEELEEVAGLVGPEPSRLLRLPDSEVRSLLQVGGKRALASLNMALVLRRLTRIGDPAQVADDLDCYPYEVARLQESVDRLLLAFEALVRSVLKGAEPPPQPLVDLLRRITALRRMVVAGLDEAAATLTFVPGIGPKMARRLVAVGIKHIEDLALSGPEDLAKVQGLSPARAAKWISAAEALVPEHSAASLQEDGPGAALATGRIPAGVDPYRLRRALELTVVRHGPGYEVTGGLEPHLVTMVAVPTCDCADFAKGNTCKHVMAVRLKSGDLELARAASIVTAMTEQIDLQRWWFGSTQASLSPLRATP